MADEEQIGLKAIFDSKEFKDAISEYMSDIDKATGQTESSGSAMSSAMQGMADVGQVAFIALSAVAVAALAEITVAIFEAMDAEDGLAELNAVLTSTGGVAGVTEKAVTDFATAMQKTTRFTDDEIISGESMLLTFTKIGADVMPRAATSMLNLAQKFGSMKSASIQLGKALNDPVAGVGALSRVGVSFTQDQKDMIKQMVEAGDVAGAQGVILKELETEFGGLAETMGGTTKGKLEIMKNSFADLQEQLGGGMLTALAGVFDKLTAFAQDPQVAAYLQELGKQLGDMASQVLAKLPDIMDTIQSVGDWFVNNKPVVVGALAAIGAALIAFGISSAIAGATAIAPMLPIIAILGAIGLAVGLLYKAWTEDWGGIQGKVKKAWEQVKPVFDQLQKWMAENLPKAIKALSTFWTNTLLPAMKVAFNWIADNVLPVLVQLVLWLGTNVPKAVDATSKFFTGTLIPAIKSVSDWFENTLLPAIQAVADFLKGAMVTSANAVAAVYNNVVVPAINLLASIWNNVLIPAMNAVASVINNYIMPVFNALANLMDAVLGVASRVLAGLWQNVLYPAISGVANAIYNYVIPVFNTISNLFNGALRSATSAIADLWRNVLSPAIQYVWDKLSPFASFISGTLYNAFNGIKSVIQWVVDRLNDLTYALNHLTLPSWLTPGSPTPWEIGLVGINEQLKKMSEMALPALQYQMNVMAKTGDVAGTTGGDPVISNVSNASQRTNNYIYGANFSINNASGMIESLQGL